MNLEQFILYKIMFCHYRMLRTYYKVVYKIYAAMSRKALKMADYVGDIQNDIREMQGVIAESQNQLLKGDKE